MASVDEANAAVQKAVLNMTRFDRVVNGGEDELVAVDDGTVRSLRGIEKYGKPGGPGPAANTSTSVTALKTADPANRSAILTSDGGDLYAWMEGDYSGASDDINTVLPTTQPATPGAWLIAPERAVGVAAVQELLTRVGNLETYQRAIANGAAKVVFVGDSVTEGISQIDYADAWVSHVMRALQATTSATLTFENFSISGRDIGDLNSDTYVGAAAGSNNVNDYYHADGRTLPVPQPTLWPGGSVIGKKWHEQIRDRGADLVVISLGINSADPQGAYGSLRNVIQNRINFWPKVPSVVLMTPSLPTRLQPSQAARVPTTNATAAGMREIARLFDLSVVDVNRNWMALLQGVDVVRQQYTLYSSLADYASWVTVSGARPTAGANLTFNTAGVVERDVPTRDGVVAATMAIPAGGVGAVWYRTSGSTGYVLQVQRGPQQAVLYRQNANGTVTALASGGVAVGSSVKVRLEYEGARHRLWIGDDVNPTIDEIDASFVSEGRVGFEGTAGLVVSDIGMDLGATRRIGRASADERRLIGVQGGTTDGNGVNHPTRFGHLVGIARAWNGLLGLLRTLPRTQGQMIVPFDVQVTQGTIVNNDFIAVRIAGNKGTDVFVLGNDIDGYGADNGLGFEVNGASALVELIRQNTSGSAVNVLASVTVNFPFAGKWWVSATARINQRSTALIRHKLSGQAVLRR